MRPMTFKYFKHVLFIVLFFFTANILYQIGSGVDDIAVSNLVLNPLDTNLGKKIDWHNYTQIEIESKQYGLGEQGAAVNFGELNKEENERLYLANGYRGFVSDSISLTRSLKDIRHPDCKKFLYYENLPNVSLVIPFFNEHLSAILRTFKSAMHRAPEHLIREVILVDDASTKPELIKPLDDYISQNYPFGNVRVIRHPKRVGLIAARLTGARSSNSQVLVFLDSHCEASINWLPPLLSPIAQNYKVVTCPFIDVIDSHTFEYRAQDEGARGAFDWEFFYKRLPRLPEDKYHPAKPFESPVMAGGLLAISTKWFWELGGYDPGLMIWGGEQYELSFKIWMCGGIMLDIPCSRIGHIYRTLSVFPSAGNFIGSNYRRVADVWMDEYKEYLYARRPQYRLVDPGDLSERKAIRERLKCKSFDWFMKNIAFDLVKHYPLVEPIPGASGHIRSVANKTLCIDIAGAKVMSPIHLKPCSQDAASQYFELSWYNEIRDKTGQLCLDVPQAGERNLTVLYECHQQRGNQEWRVEPVSFPAIDQHIAGTKESPVRLILVKTAECLDAEQLPSGLNVHKCSSDRTMWQTWLVQNLRLEEFEEVKRKAKIPKN